MRHSVSFTSCVSRMRSSWERCNSCTNSKIAYGKWRIQLVLDLNRIQCHCRSTECQTHNASQMHRMIIKECELNKVKCIHSTIQYQGNLKYDPPNLRINVTHVACIRTNTAGWLWQETVSNQPLLIISSIQRRALNFSKRSHGLYSLLVWGKSRLWGMERLLRLHHAQGVQSVRVDIRWHIFVKEWMK